MQRNFEPMRKQVETWQRSELTDVTAKVVIYEAFVEGRLEAPKHLARTVHDLYFEPKYEEFRPRDLEPFQRVHLCIQGTGTDPAIQGHSQAGRVPRGSILAVLLSYGGSGPAPRSLSRRNLFTDNFLFANKPSGIGACPPQLLHRL
jgi:hypothetical protein